MEIDEFLADARALAKITARENRYQSGSRSNR